MQFHQFGTANPHRLMLIHGLATTWQQSFGAVIPRLAANYHVIAVGMDGHDPNERREFSTSAAAATSAAEFVRREFDGHLDALYAASLGCTVAMSMVIREKVHVDHLVLDGAARPSFGVLTLPIAKLTATMVHGAARGRYALLLRLFGLTPQMRDHFLYKGASKTTLTNGCREGLTFFDMLPPATHYPDIAVACWYGSREKRLVDKGIAKLREYFPELEERAFPGYGHGEILQHPEQFIAELEGFLSSKPPRMPR
ncbi:alpha/beta fold hydrolase [Mycolicibacterium pyrenivorans]|uniref:alpha/beta fold hydrolase n=1 Tax=Mycolicibacterium pyrenivorans TaxID=187102 RepID=UPI0021F34A36|nr:alpha/beta hydrolase [Mycolicibacterium pyrenivorans]MCV7153773.1 alpha/beta hydrolase [Mycolicibacterium pyrenivorans]